MPVPGPLPYPVPALAPPWSRLMTYATLLAAAAADTGLPFWLLAAVVEQESGFNPQAHSDAGAIGLMQIMPATARDCGLDPAQLWDPARNIHWGARILADGYHIFSEEAPDERLQFALAAYNGGVGTVLSAQRLALGQGLDPHLWQSLAQVLPDVRLASGGRPDFQQIRNYVHCIWGRYQAWRLQPVPSQPESLSAV